jgi:hypothetical protein
MADKAAPRQNGTIFIAGTVAVEGSKIIQAHPGHGWLRTGYSTPVLSVKNDRFENATKISFPPWNLDLYFFWRVGKGEKERGEKGTKRWSEKGGGGGGAKGERENKLVKARKVKNI